MEKRALKDNPICQLLQKLRKRGDESGMHCLCHRGDRSLASQGTDKLEIFWRCSICLF